MKHALVEREGTTLRARCGAVGRATGGKQPETFTAWATEVSCSQCGPVTAEQWRAIHAARSRSGDVVGCQPPAPSPAEQQAATQPLIERVRTAFSV